MSIKKLQRYQVDTCFTMPDDNGAYCLSDDATELEATNAELVKMLKELLGTEGIIVSHHNRELVKKLLAKVRGDL